MYRLFYNYGVSKDVLFVLIDPSKKVTSTKRVEEVEALYNENELVGYNIFDVSKTVKINAEGIIFLPEAHLVDAINNILSRTSFPLLPKAMESGFTVLKIQSLEEHPLDEKASIVTLEGKDGQRFETVSKAKNLSVGDLCVAAKDGAILADGTLFRKGIEKNIPIDVLLMSPKMLKLGTEEDVLFVPKEGDYQIGDDFF